MLRSSIILALVVDDIHVHALLKNNVNLTASILDMIYIF